MQKVVDMLLQQEQNQSPRVQTSPKQKHQKLLRQNSKDAKLFVNYECNTHSNGREGTVSSGNATTKPTITAKQSSQSNINQINNFLNENGDYQEEVISLLEEKKNKRQQYYQNNNLDSNHSGGELSIASSNKRGSDNSANEKMKFSNSSSSNSINMKSKNLNLEKVCYQMMDQMKIFEKNRISRDSISDSSKKNYKLQQSRTGANNYLQIPFDDQSENRSNCTEQSKNQAYQSNIDLFKKNSSIISRNDSLKKSPKRFVDTNLSQNSERRISKNFLNLEPDEKTNFQGQRKQSKTFIQIFDNTPKRRFSSNQNCKLKDNQSFGQVIQSQKSHKQSLLLPPRPQNKRRDYNKTGSMLCEIQSDRNLTFGRGKKFTINNSQYEEEDQQTSKIKLRSGGGGKSGANYTYENMESLIDLSCHRKQVGDIERNQQKIQSFYESNGTDKKHRYKEAFSSGNINYKRENSQIYSRAMGINKAQGLMTPVQKKKFFENSSQRLQYTMSTGGTNRSHHYKKKENNERFAQIGAGEGGRGVDLYENQEYKKKWLKKRNPDTNMDQNFLPRNCAYSHKNYQNSAKGMIEQIRRNQQSTKKQNDGFSIYKSDYYRLPPEQQFVSLLLYLPKAQQQLHVIRKSAIQEGKENSPNKVVSGKKFGQSYSAPLDVAQQVGMKKTKKKDRPIKLEDEVICCIINSCVFEKKLLR